MADPPHDDPSRDREHRDPVDRYLDELRQAEFFQDASHHGSFEWYLDYYRRRAPWRRRLFRFTGVWAIAASTLLPLIAAFGKQIEAVMDATYGESVLFRYELWIGVASTTIALAGGVQAFFRWDVTWQGYVDAQRDLEYLKDKWQLAVAVARGRPDPARALGEVRSATAAFVHGARKVVRDEAKGFFSRLTFPDVAATEPPSSES